MNPLPGAQADAGAVGVGALLAGRYLLEARVGAGGMATIYRGRDELLERAVAVKVLHPHLAADPSFLARFRTEARNAAALLHPHIVTVFDQGVVDQGVVGQGVVGQGVVGQGVVGGGGGEAGLPYIVMEYVDGPSLREVLGRRRRLSAAEALAVVEPVCRALARAHAAGVVHRDVKPENVLVGPDGTPKVADFGIARAAAETNHTTTGTIVGSVHYLAPELVDGREATSASDQYAVGVLLYELLTGHKPLPADTPMAVMLRHAREAVPPPGDAAPDLPPAVDAVVVRATALDPRKRYPDLLALAAALRVAVPGGPAPVAAGGDDGRAVVIPPEAATTRLARRRRQRRRGRVRQSRARRTAVAVAVAVLALGTVLGVWHWVVAPFEPVPKVAGVTRDAAEAALADAGLGLAVAARRHDVDAPAGTVLGQQPAPGTALRRGGQVRVVVSLGPDEVEVPAVAGRPWRRARRQLAGAPYFFDVAVVERFSRTVEAGHVIAVTPTAGETLPQARRVTLTVSKGVEQVRVPAVVGETRADAVAALRDAKLRVKVTEAYRDDAPNAGTVAEQSVRPRRRVDRGTRVALVVSLGPLTVSMPNVNGHGLDDARAELERLGLGVRVTEQARPLVGPFRRGAFGRVEAQVPEPGAGVRRGETVDLYTFSRAAERRDG